MKNEEKFINEGGMIGADVQNKGWTKEEHVAYKAIVDKIQSERTPEQKMQIKFRFLDMQMGVYLNQNRPFKSIGTFLKEHLETVGVTNKAFAKFVKIEPLELSEIIKGKRKISLDLAVVLGQLFEATASLWISIQNKNELILLEEKMSKKKKKKISIKKLAKKAS